jgi:hypothetical protein
MPAAAPCAWWSGAWGGRAPPGPPPCPCCSAEHPPPAAPPNAPALACPDSPRTKVRPHLRTVGDGTRSGGCASRARRAAAMQLLCAGPTVRCLPAPAPLPVPLHLPSVRPCSHTHCTRACELDLEHVDFPGQAGQGAPEVERASSWPWLLLSCNSMLQSPAPRPVSLCSPILLVHHTTMQQGWRPRVFATAHARGQEVPGVSRAVNCAPPSRGPPISEGALRGRFRGGAPLLCDTDVVATAQTCRPALRPCTNNN